MNSTPHPRQSRSASFSDESSTADRVSPLSPPPDSSFREERPGDFIGPYKLQSVLGEGGFGVVWLAERREPHIQRVALKIIKPGMDSKTVIARFEQERQALAMMDHANIARVFDAGATPLGRPFFVMEHVPGESITAYCDRHNLSLRQRLELFIPVCGAVHHAHMKGIIHRDIKPSNILVCVKDGVACPIVIDFGVAKAISHTLTDKTIFTERGQIIGTPEYMSPEQAEMGATSIDSRTDVYSLGVVLYELLTGLLPFDPKSLRRAGYAEIQRIIREVDPPKPSTRLTSLRQQPPSNPDSAEIARHRHTEIDRLTRELRSELDWIPLVAMRKDRTERYATPAAMAHDIRRYLAGQPIGAKPTTALYRIRKFTRRHQQAIVGVTAATVLIAVGVIATSSWMNQRNHSANSAATQAGREQGATSASPPTVFAWLATLVPLVQLEIQPMPPDGKMALLRGSVLNKDELKNISGRLEKHADQVRLEVSVDADEVARRLESRLNTMATGVRVQARNRPDRFDDFYLDIRFDQSETATAAKIRDAAMAFVLEAKSLQITPNSQ